MLGNLLLGLTLISSPALAGESMSPLAEQSSQKNEMVRVEIKVVHATTKHKNVDAQVKPLMKYFQNYRFTGYRLINTKKARLPDKGSKQFVISGNRRVKLKLISHDQKKARLKVEISGEKGAKLLDSTMVLNRNGTLIVAGPKFKGGVLFLPLTINY